LHDKDSNKIIPTAASKFQVIARKERIGSTAASVTKEMRKKVAPDADDDDDDNNSVGDNNDDDYDDAASLFDSSSDDEDNNCRKGSRQKKGKKRLGNVRKVSATKEAKTERKHSPDPFLQYQGGSFCFYKNSNRSLKTYRCNRYCAPHSCNMQEWRNFKRAKALSKRGIVVHCTGVMCVPVHNGVKSVPWFKGEHECGWEVPQLLLGEPDGCPMLELVQPSQCSGGLVSPQERCLIVETLEVVGIWSKVTGGGIRQREYAKTLADDSFALLVVTKAMKPYVQHVQERYPSLIHIKYGALRTFPHKNSYHSRHGQELHSNYKVDCKDLPPLQWPISIILALDDFRSSIFRLNSSQEAISSKQQFIWGR
jgi:hypothetical protein